ncbi:hypothetical protein DQ04_10481020 [Trypanosoma grayi]|uniref:hypothetical protein n=1 Tax=Trypanosoma grayi TaxID=71804 RepID=UPI0004F3F9FD|nr:hypothetical protein DQ04_10481020 [Trypanosoma grayi]KEG07234.1 hypothetical protein DQ04_10481020 [Trypanosoma grayi]
MMYGYAAPPPPPPGDDRLDSKTATKRSETLQNGGADGATPLDDDDDEEEEEEEEEEDGVNGDSRSATVTDVGTVAGGDGGGSSAAAQGTPFGEAFQPPEGDSDGDHEEEKQHQLPMTRLQSRSPPALTVLRFTDANRLFYLVRAANGRRWYLLDELPPRAGRHSADTAASKATTKRKSGGRTDDDDDDGEEEEEEEEEDEEEAEEEEEEEEAEAVKEGGAKAGEEQQEEEDDGVPSAQQLDMDTLICIDALMLAALQSPTALRCCLSQREPVSLACMEAWLRIDLQVALPICTTIHRMMLSVYATASTRLPYPLPGAVLDFNLFFTPMYFNHGMPVYPRLHINAAATLVGETGIIETMEALLKVCVVPSRRILTRHLSSVVGIRLLLWLLMNLPKPLLVAWASAPTAGEDDADRNNNDNDDRAGFDDDNGDDYDDSDEETESLRRVANYGAAAADAFLQRALQKEGSRFVLSPFLHAVVTELRRRQMRELEGEAPSQFTLMECVGHALLQRVEDGKPRRDPLVTSAFSLLPVEDSGTADASTTLLRSQRLYQSDLVMLLLVLTTTPARRGIILPETESRRSVVVRSRIPQLFGLPDAHHELFQYLLRKKTEKVHTPVELTQSGYFRLLYMCLLRFKSLCMVQLLLSMTPLFAVLGPQERCPFGDLLQAWVLDRTQENVQHLELFLDTFWNELYYRCRENQFDEETLARARTMVLLERIQERRKAYSNVLQSTSSPARTPLRPRLQKFPSQTSLHESTTSSSSQSHRQQRSKRHAKSIVSGIGVGNFSICECSEECHMAEDSVRVAFEALSMVPRTYLTPETLHTLLFEKHSCNVYAVRYLMIRCRVVTVQANPLKDAEVPVMEYALRRGGTQAISVLLAIGETLRDHINAGTVAEDMLLCETLTLRDSTALLQKWRCKEALRRVDPSVHYGIVRTVPSAS